MYGEPFDIPVPDELIFLSWFKGGEVFRSGCTFQRGRGRIFFFGPGHETFPISQLPETQKPTSAATSDDMIGTHISMHPFRPADRTLPF